MSEPCGSWRVLRYVEAYEYDVRWCERTDGPCPFPGTTRAKKHAGDDEHRRCATEPGTVLRVKWADAAVVDALGAMRALDHMGTTPNAQNVQIAIDALARCVDEDPSSGDSGDGST